MEKHFIINLEFFKQWNIKADSADKMVSAWIDKVLRRHVNESKNGGKTNGD